MHYNVVELLLRIIQTERRSGITVSLGMHAMKFLNHIVTE